MGSGSESRVLLEHEASESVQEAVRCGAWRSEDVSIGHIHTMGSHQLTDGV